MNQKTTYEQLITEKLEGTPVPDMADAIWARIERQLDIEMPTDDSGTDPDPDSPSSSGWVGGAGLFVFVAALVTIFFINKNHKKSVQPIPSPVQNIHQPDSGQITPSKQGVIESSKFFNKENMEVEFKAPINATPFNNDRVTNKDTISVIPPAVIFEPFQPDTIQKVTTVVSPPVQQDSVKPKRPRGVTGITDKDYRVVPGGKDSAKSQ